MSELVKINLNDKVKVKLTVAGIKAYIDHMNEPNERAKSGQPIKSKWLLPSIDDEGYTQFQLWEFINIFGEYFYIGNNEQVIMPLEIIKSEPEKWTIEGQREWDEKHPKDGEPE